MLEKDAQKSPVIAKRLPWILPSLCEGCGACANRCPKQCLEMTSTNIDGFEIPWLEDPSLCSGCGLCEKACPMGAINMTTYFDRAIARLNDKERVINQLQKNEVSA